MLETTREQQMMTNSLFKKITVLENHPQDSRIKIKDDGIFQTMGARGGHGVRTPHAYGYGGARLEYSS